MRRDYGVDNPLKELYDAKSALNASLANTYHGPKSQAISTFKMNTLKKTVVRLSSPE